VWIINHDVYSPCSDAALNAHRFQNTGSETESWNATIESEEVIREMDKIPGIFKWAPILQELVKLTPPNTIVNFELLWRDPQPTWSSKTGRIVQIGDAAHSYLPASSNGATQAIEDAIHIASCLQIGGRDKVAQSVGVHCYLRFIRNACAQRMGFANAENLQDTKWEEVKVDPRRARPKLPRWIYLHDPEAYAYQSYEKAVKGIKEGLGLDENPDIQLNFPPGYKYDAWNIKDIMDDAKKGKRVQLGAGEWE
jgi:hypothetical protein